MNNKDKHYILLLEQIIGRIKVNPSKEYLEKLNLNIDTNKKKKRLSIKELESLERIIETPVIPPSKIVLGIKKLSKLNAAIIAPIVSIIKERILLER